jgi:hypothetical protein
MSALPTISSYVCTDFYMKDKIYRQKYRQKYLLWHFMAMARCVVVVSNLGTGLLRVSIM